MKLLNFLKSSGSDFAIENKTITNGRVIGTVTVEGNKLKGRKIFGRQAAGLIDSAPFLSLMSSLADGTTIIRDIAEYVDYNRNALSDIAAGLNEMDIKNGVLEDGIAIENVKELNGSDFKPFTVRETALTFYMAALAGVGKSTIDGFELVNQNYPSLVDTLRTGRESSEALTRM
jgi:5-enolpyruvylshikimate-3-phosphate synthase